MVVVVARRTHMNSSRAERTEVKLYKLLLNVTRDGLHLLIVDLNIHTEDIFSF